jgi:glutamate synthase (NADPH/NADH) large chain
MMQSKGLYDPSNEHDACGVGFVAHIKNRKSHEIVAQGLGILCNLEHRGAVGADPLAGDGAGILIQIPDRLFRAESERLGFTLPEPGAYAVGMMFLPRDAARRRSRFLWRPKGKDSSAGATCPRRRARSARASGRTRR